MAEICRMYKDVEMNIVGIERIQEYIDQKQEVN